MNKQVRLYLCLPILLVGLALLAACRSGDGADTAPSTLPTDPASQSPRPLSAAERIAVGEFASQQEAVGLEWDQFHQEFDEWRSGLTSCHESAAQDALRRFAAASSNVTQQARNLPRSRVTKEFADILIEAAEAEETAFRRLRDRWQPGNLSLFEAVEEGRSTAARAQNEVEDLSTELQDELEEDSDPEDTQAREEFSAALDVISDDWEAFHDDYGDLLREAGGLTLEEILARLDQLIQQFDAVSEAVGDLPDAAAVEDMTKILQDTAEDERTALIGIHDILADAAEEAAAVVEEDEEDTPIQVESGRAFEPLLNAMGTVIEDVEETLDEVNEMIKEILDRDAADDLEKVQDFIGNYQALLEAWDGFHQEYASWQRSEGGCDRSRVLSSLGEFDQRAGEIGLGVRDLPRTGYLLPMYNLLVEAAEREEGAIRTLRNSWQPFTVDAFIALDRERDTVSRLRREANIALQELQERP